MILTTRRDDRWLFLVTLGVTTLAGVVRVAFVLLVLESARAPPLGHQAGFLTNDSPGYMAPAQELLRGNVRGIGTLERPPGYPLFLVLSAARPAGALLAQALLGALVAGATLLLTHALTRSLWLSAGAGLVAAVSPTGIGVTGLIMADLVLAAVFGTGLLLLVRGAKTHDPRWLLSAGALFALGILVKPILLPWAPFGVLAGWLLARAPPHAWSLRSLLAFVTIQWIPAGLWAACNYARDGVATVSSVGTITARVYLAAQTDAWAQARGRPDDALLRRIMHTAEARLDSLPTAAEQLRWALTTTSTILWAHPRQAVHAYLDNVDASTGGGWDYFDRQLTAHPWLTAVGEHAARIEAAVRSRIRWLLLTALMLAFVALLFPGGRKPAAFDLCALAIPVLYFVGFSGVTFWTGPRIVYPAAIAAIAMSAVTLQVVVRGLAERTAG